jgi:hypothetical protein
MTLAEKQAAMKMRMLTKKARAVEVVVGSKAFCYLRGDDIASQKLSILAYAKQSGIRPQGWFDDLDALSAALRSTSGIEIVLFESLRVLADRVVEQEAIFESFECLGAKLVSVKEPYLSEGAEPTRVALRQFLGAINEYQRSFAGVTRISNELAPGRPQMGPAPAGEHQAALAAAAAAIA